MQFLWEKKQTNNPYEFFEIIRWLVPYLYLSIVNSRFPVLNTLCIANYQEEGGECHFTFNPGQIEVKEYDCGHGASCGTFDGFYTKF